MASLAQQVAANAAAIQQILENVKTLAQLPTIANLSNTSFVIVVDSADSKGKKILKPNLLGNVVSIDGYIVDVTNNVDKSQIEVGNIIMGQFAAGHFIIAEVINLPHTVWGNLYAHVDSQKI